MYIEAFKQDTGELWEQFSFLSDDWYLAGGTALALHIGHRVSIDLDFFSFESLPKSFLKTVEENFPGKTITVLVNTSTELTVLVEGVKVTFLHYPFALQHATIPSDVVPLASVQDIATMKTYTIGRRQSLKDYVDMYFLLLERHVTLGSVIEGTEEVYGSAFNSRLFCEQLLYTADLEQEPIVWLKPEVSLATMQEFFQGEVKTVMSE
jgi:hypothetical protein